MAGGGAMTDGEMLALGLLIIGDAAKVAAVNHNSQQQEQHGPVYFTSDAYDALAAELRRRGVLPAKPHATPEVP